MIKGNAAKIFAFAKRNTNLLILKIISFAKQMKKTKLIAQIRSPFVKNWIFMIKFLKNPHFDSIKGF